MIFCYLITTNYNMKLRVFFNKYEVKKLHLHHNYQITN